jgi:hypothetical protein
LRDPPLELGQKVGRCVFERQLTERGDGLTQQGKFVPAPRTALEVLFHRLIFGRWELTLKVFREHVPFMPAVCH